MLKIWKQTWNKDDVSHGSNVGRDSNLDTQMREPDAGKSTQASSSAVPPVFEHHVLGPVESLPQAPALSKPARSIGDLEQATDITSARPFKRRKTEELHDYISHDPLITGNLPEMVDRDDVKAISKAEVVGWDIVNRILAQLQRENAIAIVDDASLKFKIVAEVLKWFCSNEREKPRTGFLRRRKTALVVTDDVDTTFLSEHGELSFGVYVASYQDTDHNWWTDLVAKDVIFVSAQLLLESLNSGRLAISQVHLLVVDDAVKVKDEETHPIRQIMRDFYRITDRLSRPRMFSVLAPAEGTAFIVDVRVLGLEHILDARISGLSESTGLAGVTLEKPTEMVVFYDPQLNNAETPLMKQLRAYDPKEILFRKHFRNARRAQGELGSCACDLVWKRAMKTIEVSPKPVYEEEDEIQPDSAAAIDTAKRNAKNAIKNWSFAMPNLDATSRGYNLTPKFARLIQVLKACEPEGDSFKGIIFVHKRVVAIVLADLIRMLDDHVGFLRVQTLTSRNDAIESSNQREVIDSFKSGLCNLIIATKSTEDLDIAPASMVIRFDLFDSQVSYAHCRARTKEHQSHLVHLAERGNDVHRRILSQTARLDNSMQRWILHVARSPGSAIPPGPLRETIDPYRSDSDDEDESTAAFIMDPTTSGRLYIQDATTAIYRFVAGISHQENAPSEPLFEYEVLHNSIGLTPEYICTVLLPKGVPVQRVSGAPCETKAEARRSACFEACSVLFRRGLLDYRLFPKPPQRALGAEWDTDKDDDLAKLPAKALPGQNKSTGTRIYPVKKPDFWLNTLPIMNGYLYPTIVVPVIDVADPTGLAYGPIAILTRLPLPPFAASNLFFSGVAAKVHFYRGAAFEIEVGSERLRDLHQFTLRIIRSSINKSFVCSLEKTAYFIAPLQASWSPPDSEDDTASLPGVADSIRWDVVQQGAHKWIVALKTHNLESLAGDVNDTVVQDRWAEFTRRYYCSKLRPDLTPLSKPEDSLREKDFDNLVEYCKARLKGFEGLQDYNQPLIEVAVVPPAVNHLDPTSRPAESDAKRPTAKYLIPELCAKCTIPASTFRTALLLPSVLHRLDDLLIVKELNAKFFDHSIWEHHLHVAISSPSAAIEFDYERLELLGDAYLKYLSSIYLFVTNPSQSEGVLHLARQHIISNRALLYNANRCGLPQYIQSKPFTTKQWAPPNFHIGPPSQPKEKLPAVPVQELEEGEIASTPKDSPAPTRSNKDFSVKIADNEDLRQDDVASSKVPGQAPVSPEGKQGKNKEKQGKKKKKTFDFTETQCLGDKAVADVAEAIIGAAYITGGREVALKVTKALNIPVPHIDRWSDFGRKALAPPPEVTAKLRDGSIEAVETVIGHKFNHPHLLAQALTHSSIHGNEMTSYERLEFIGDAILDFLVIRHLFNRDGMLSPGALTLLKGAMVSNAALAAVCVWSGLYSHLHFESVSLAVNIRGYAEELKRKQELEYKLAAREGRPPGQYWVDIEPPKALSDVVESIMGAVYVSDNFSPDGAEAFFENILKPFYDQHITLQTLSHHPTKILFELLQSRGCTDFLITKEFATSADDKNAVQCDVLVHNVILASATDATMTLAARRACLYSLDALEGDPDFIVRTCDCRKDNQAKKASKKAAESMLLQLDEADELFVEGVLASEQHK